MNPTKPDPFLQAAIDEAKKGLAAGGIPIGSVLTFPAFNSLTVITPPTSGLPLD